MMLYVQLSLIKIMTALRQDHQAEIKSVDRLLEISEMKHFLQENQNYKSQHFSPRHRYKDTPIKYQHKQMGKNLSLSLKKSLDLRSKQYEYETQGNRIFYDQKNDYLDGHDLPQNYKAQQLKNSPNSQPFPQVSRLSAKRDSILSMNSTFNPSSTARYSRNQNDFAEPYRYIRGDELSSVFRNKQQKPKNGLVYLRPNKSETIRELLNQMKLQRAKHKFVQFDSMLHQGEEYPTNTSIMFSENQVKQLKKYKNFMPFRQDSRLLIQKIGDKQSIWKRKFKLSWQKRKDQLQTHKYNLKPIPKK